MLVGGLCLYTICLYTICLYRESIVRVQFINKLSRALPTSGHAASLGRIPSSTRASSCIPLTPLRLPFLRRLTLQRLAFLRSPFQCPFVCIPSFHRFLRPPLLLLLFRLRDVAIVQGRDAAGRCSVAIARGHGVVERRSTQGRDIVLTGRGRCVAVITQGRGVVGRCSAQGAIPPVSHDEGVVLSFGRGASVPSSATCESARVWVLSAHVAEVSAVVGVVVGAGASVARSAGWGS